MVRLVMSLHQEGHKQALKGEPTTMSGVRYRMTYV
jgi:hypothetical protein